MCQDTALLVGQNDMCKVNQNGSNHHGVLGAETTDEDSVVRLLLKAQDRGIELNRGQAKLCKDRDN